MATFTCNCEHVKHFPLGETYGGVVAEPVEWADIPRDGHKYLETVIAEHEPDQAAWLGDVCQACYVGCLGYSLTD